MIGLDTNVLVRYVTGDDAAQSAAAVRIMHSLASDHQGFVSLLVMAEMVWVFESAYGFEKKEILQVLETLLQSKELVIESSEIVWQSLRCFAGSNADFADCLIERSGHAAGCEHTLTFDKTAASGAGMRMLK
jgi:predicted nucleic-acid-binding protein